MEKLHQRLGGVSINLKFIFSGTSLVYSEKYGLKTFEGQKNTLLSQHPSPFHSVHASDAVFVLMYLTVSYRFMTYYLSLHNFCLFTSAIDLNVVNPSNNNFNRKKIIITIFVNETKCIFEKNYKKKHSKNDSKFDCKN